MKSITIHEIEDLNFQEVTILDIRKEEDYTIK